MVRPTAMDRAAIGAPIPAAAGIGLRFPHHGRVLAERPPIAWLEVHPENYLGCGPAAEILHRVRTDYPLSLHATGLSLGSTEGPDPGHLAAIDALCRRIEPGLVSDHLSWSRAGGLHLPDLLPLPYTEEALEVVARNVEQVQQALGRPILIENPSTYLRFAASAMGEEEFLAALVGRTGCGVLLDVNNLFVSARNLGDDPGQRLGRFLAALPPGAIGEIHLAGHATRRLPGGSTLLIDDHGSRVSSQVWSLFEATIAAVGPKPTLIEWDTQLPSLDVLVDEADAASDRLKVREAGLALAG
jgi:uncharacterized protein (UPF0276 family)